MKQITVNFIILCIIVLFSCKKESFITSGDARISVTVDSLRFDTVFTSVGSITQLFKVKNENNQKLRISNITLKGGAASPFKINADGIVGPDVKNIEVDANDSVYVFVSVSINPTVANLPFVVQDSIEIGYNGNVAKVQLEAWGQNANFLRSRRLTGTVNWTNTLPYVILGGIQVDTNATLNIQAGTKIYLHADAPFIVDGTLKVNGEKFDSTRVYFAGDRRDEPYSNYPAAWPGIYFRGTSKDNVLNFAVIKNSYQGIVTEQPSVTANPKISLNECIIDNVYDAGILAVRSSLQARNCIISNCGKNIQLVYGGNYQFTHCTVASYSTLFNSHKDPVLFITNAIKDGNNSLIADMTASFTNCIFWGDNGTVDDEVVTSKQGANPFIINFQNCLWKYKTAPANVNSSNMILNQDPKFDSVNTSKPFFVFRLKSDSPAINKGAATGTPIDIDGNPRPVGLPDLGAYEKQ